MQEISVSNTKKANGTISMPGDKSISHRAIILGAIAEGNTTIKGMLKGEDCLSTIAVFRKLGTIIEEISDEEIVVYGRGLNGLSKPTGVLDAGNSGTTMRLVSGLLAGQNFTSTITGDASLCKRPMKRIIDPLGKMGAYITPTHGNLPPLIIRGTKLKGIDYKSKIASAQVKSCLLLAGLYTNGVTSITEPVKSRDHTERILSYMGCPVTIDGLRVEVKGRSKIEAKDITVAGDISSAAFFILCGLLLDGSIRIKNVGLNPTRTGILKVFEAMGANISVEGERMICNEPVGDIVVKSSTLKGISIGSKLVPSLIDEFPILAVAATQAEGVTRISGASELRVKETDRINAICSELGRMGAKIEEKSDGMLIHGRTPLKGAIVESFKDHRMAMSLAIAGLIAEGKTTIKDTDCINTSFPHFMDKLKSVTSL
ncbi:MAG: 3-phosphoshikimate 1-carboxyvinyltransferase [bacterium]